MNEEGKMLAAKYAEELEHTGMMFEFSPRTIAYRAFLDGYLDGHKHAKINITNKKLHKKLTVSPNQTRLI